MRIRITLVCCSLIFTPLPGKPKLGAQGRMAQTVRVYLTTADLSQRLTRQPDLHFSPGRVHRVAMIHVDDMKTYQQIDGFGGALTDTSAWLLSTKLAPAARDTLMHNLFDTAHGIGLGFLRLPMRASDFGKNTALNSCHNAPPASTPPTPSRFSIPPDLTNTVPLWLALRK